MGKMLASSALASLLQVGRITLFTLGEDVERKESLGFSECSINIPYDYSQIVDFPISDFSLRSFHTVLHHQKTIGLDVSDEVQ